MKKIFLIGLVVFLGFANASFADCCKNSPSGNSNCQKACQNIFSLIAIDLSLLSPRAAAADIDTCMPKNCCMPQTPCCTPQTPCCVPQNPCCCPKQSMTPTDDKQKATITANNTENAIIPVANKQLLNNPCAKPKDKKSFFRVDLFRIFQIKAF